MSRYIVERSLPGITMDELAIAQAAIIEACFQLTVAGQRVRYLGSTFAPAQSRCLCLFEADSASAVELANALAHLPCGSVIEVVELAPWYSKAA